MREIEFCGLFLQFGQKSNDLHFNPFDEKNGFNMNIPFRILQVFLSFDSWHDFFFFSFICNYARLNFQFKLKSSYNILIVLQCTFVHAVEYFLII